MIEQGGSPFDVLMRSGKQFARTTRARLAMRPQHAGSTLAPDGPPARSADAAAPNPDGAAAGSIGTTISPSLRRMPSC